MGFVLYALAFGATLFVHALIITIARSKYGVSSADTVTDMLLVDTVTLIMFSVLWIIFETAYKALL
jgi:hypothetical protein